MIYAPFRSKSSLSAISACLGGKQVGVAVGDVDTFMPHPVSDCQGGEAHVNQQGNVAECRRS